MITSVISLYMYIYFNLDLYGIVINCIAIMCVNKRLIKFMNANSMTSCVGRYLEVFDELLHALLTGEEDNKAIFTI